MATTDKNAGGQDASAPLKAHQALTVHAEITPGAPLTLAIQGACGLARRMGCAVRFMHIDEEIRVTPDDTYQGVQQRLRKTKGKA